MIYLFEALWYGLIIDLYFIWIPIVVIICFALLFKAIGAIKRQIKENKKEK